MMRPVRLQLSRRKGFDLQAWSRRVNGLEAQRCTRPTEFGNRFRIGSWYRESWHGLRWVECYAKLGVSIEGFTLINDAQTAVSWYRKYRRENPLRGADVERLRGKNLACYCHLCPKHAAAGKPLDEHCPDCAPCHVDVLGDIICEAVG